MTLNNNLKLIIDYNSDDIEKFIQMLNPFHLDLIRHSNEYNICYVASIRQMIYGQGEIDSSYNNKCIISNVISAICKVIDKL